MPLVHKHFLWLVQEAFEVPSTTFLFRGRALSYMVQARGLPAKKPYQATRG